MDHHDVTPPQQEDPTGSAKLSKTQQKKQARRESWLEKRDERRKLEREKRKLKRKRDAESRPQDGSAPVRLARVTMANSSNKFKVVIDMDFEKYMTDAEIAKAVQQVGRIYALNRKSPSPCQLYITSLGGKIRDRFAITNTGYQNWDVNHSELHYMTLLGTEGDNQPGNKSRFIYLSGDAEMTLPDVDNILREESTIFVIGGLVDHNRHKNLCLELANKRGIATAKLPIKEHLNLCQRHILSTVTVFEVMLNVLAYKKQWRDALLASIPKRKIAPSLQGEDSRSTETEGVSVKTGLKNDGGQTPDS